MNFIKECSAPVTEDTLDNAKFIIDNNVLLYPLKDHINSQKILEAFEKIKEHTYIPFVTQVEYLENENRIVNSTKANLGKSFGAITTLRESENIINEAYIKSKLEDKLFKLLNTVKNEDDMKSFVKEANQFKEEFYTKINEDIKQSIEKLNEKINTKLDETLGSFPWSNFNVEDYVGEIDSIKVGLQNWLDSTERGEIYSTEKLNEFNSTIKQRYELKQSPGYEDVEHKEGEIIILGGVPVARSFSDAIFWLDALDYFSNSETDKKYLIILSNEKKADWVNSGDSSSLKIDMVTECYDKTGLVAKKIDIWKFMELNGIDRESIDNSKSYFEDDSSRSLTIFGKKIGFEFDYEFILIVFKEVIQKHRLEFQNIRGISGVSEVGEYPINTPGFGSQKKLKDSTGYEFVIGTQTVKEDKLKHIKTLFDICEIDYNELIFEEQQLNDLWEKVQYSDD